MLRLPLSSKGIRLKIMPGGRTPSRQRRCLNFEAGAWAHDGEVRRRVLMELIARIGVFFSGGTKHVDDRAPPPDHHHVVLPRRHPSGPWRRTFTARHGRKLLLGRSRHARWEYGTAAPGATGLRTA